MQIAFPEELEFVRAGVGLTGHPAEVVVQVYVADDRGDLANRGQVVVIQVAGRQVRVADVEAHRHRGVVDLLHLFGDHIQTHPVGAPGEHRGSGCPILDRDHDPARAGLVGELAQHRAFGFHACGQRRTVAVEVRQHPGVVDQHLGADRGGDLEVRQQPELLRGRGAGVEQVAGTPGRIPRTVQGQPESAIGQRVAQRRQSGALYLSADHHPEAAAAEFGIAESGGRGLIEEFAHLLEIGAQELLSRPRIDRQADLVRDRAAVGRTVRRRVCEYLV